MNPKQDLQIDRDRLDDEWVAQAPMRRDYGRKVAEVRKLHAEAKNTLAVVEAELYLVVSKCPEEFGLAKSTENSIKAAVQSHVKRQEAFIVMLEAKHDLDIWEATATAVDDRKKALPDLVSLFLSGYFGEPKAKGREAQEYVERVKSKRAFKPIDGKRRKATE